MCSTYDRALRPPWPLLGAHEHVYFTYDRALAALLANPAVSVIRMIVLLRLSWPLQGLIIIRILRMIAILELRGAQNHLYYTYDCALRPPWPLLWAHEHVYFTYDLALAA